MTRKLRVAVVGSGIGAHHVAAFAALPEQFEVAVISGQDRARAASLAASVAGGRAEVHGPFDDALLARDDIDIIDICTPPYLHFDQVARSLRAGRHVICEKPLVGSLAEMDALAGIVAQTGRSLMPIFQVRFGNGLARAQHLIRTGAAGLVFHSLVETHWSRDAAYYAVPWRGKRATELGGAFMTHAIHIHDVMSSLLGPVRSVRGAVATRVNPIETEDCGGAVLEMADGSIAMLSVTLGAAAAASASRLRIHFENVTIESAGTIGSVTAEPWNFTPRPPRDQAWLDAALAGAPAGLEGFAAQFNLFHAALATGRPPPITLADARASLEIAAAIYRSSATGECVKLPIRRGEPGYASLT